jgi:hypothetical protein
VLMLLKQGFQRFLLQTLAVLPLCLSSGIAAEAGASTEAVIEETQGWASIIDEAGEKREARIGEYVLAGEIIETGEDGYIRLLLPDRSTLELKDNTRITLNDTRVSEGAISSILLFIGRIFAEVEPAEGDTSFELETATAVCGVRGTTFTAAAGADGATRVGVDDGKVAVRADDKELELSAGEETTVQFGARGLEKARYIRSEDEWRRWREKREKYLIENADTMVQEMMQGVVITQKLLHAQDRKLKIIVKQYKYWEKRQGLRVQIKPRLRPRQKQEIKKMVRNYYILTKTLQRADNRMMANYFLIQRLSHDASAHPEKYSPELILKIGQVKSDMDALHIPRIHQRNRKSIEVHAELLQKIMKRYKDQAQLKGRLSEEQKERLKDYYEQKRKSRP